MWVDYLISNLTFVKENKIKYEAKRPNRELELFPIVTTVVSLQLLSG